MLARTGSGVRVHQKAQEEALPLILASNAASRRGTTAKQRRVSKATLTACCGNWLRTRH
jgi:hypothetical protein